MNGEQHAGHDTTPPGGTGNTPVDLDLLADYLGGALEGTGAGQRVAGLIRTDPAWRSGHDSLVEADRAVRTDLSSLATDTPPMPTDVLFQLTAALRAADPAADGATGSSAPVHSLAEHANRTARWRQARWRRARWVMGAAAAVVLFALAGLATASGLFRSSQSGNDRASSGQNQARAATSAPPGGAMTPKHAPAMPPAQGSTPVTASGTDYTRTTLPDVQHQTFGGAPNLNQQSRNQVPASLQRLTVPQELDRCLSSVTSSYPGSPQLVDYARFQGEPALVVVLRSSRSGQMRYVVAGPDCSSAGPDVRYATP